MLIELVKASPSQGNSLPGLNRDCTSLAWSCSLSDHGRVIAEADVLRLNPHLGAILGEDAGPTL
ncbi:hypothetical protein AY600_12155 [Phormidium willei BDU 130791]|nr:hypothetical protein AY600_12155 [Phormidium willei BDU 130791]